jgi:hypothetical protein
MSQRSIRSTLLRMTRQSAVDVGESLKKSYKRTSENSRPLASYNVLVSFHEHAVVSNR